MNTERQQGYEALLSRGYRAGMYGLAMHRPNTECFNRPDLFVIDDWR